MPVEFWIIFAVFILIDIFFVLGVLLRKKKKLGAKDKVYFRNKWEKITKMDNHSAVMEADKLLHFYLIKLGYRGAMGEILKAHPKLFRDIDAIWYAHKQRNKIAHEVGFVLSESDKKRVLGTFFNACRDLGL